MSHPLAKMRGPTIHGGGMPPPQRGDDCLTTFLGGIVGLTVAVIAVVLLLSFLFG